MKKKLMSVMLAVIMVLSMVACGTKEEGTQADSAADKDSDGKKTVGLLTYSLAEEYGVDTKAGAEKAAKALGWSLEVPDPAGDLQKQISQLEDMIQKKVDAIMISPVDGQAIVPYIKEALDAGIKVINYDIEAEMEGCEAVILADNIEGGKMAAKELGEEIGGKGKVLVLSDNPGVVCIDQRCQGFKDEMEESYPDIEIVEQISNGTRDTHQKTTENMLTAHPDLSGIFAPDGDHTLGAYAACNQMGADDVKVMGYDASLEQVKIMKDDGKDGILLGSIAQFPIMLGRVCVETTEKVLQGETFSDIIYVEIGMASAKDIDSFEFLE